MAKVVEAGFGYIEGRQIKNAKDFEADQLKRAAISREAAGTNQAYDQRKIGERVQSDAIAIMAASGCSVHTNANLTEHATGYQTDVTTIQVVSAVVEGKNLYIPSTIIVTDGAPTTLSLFNTTGKPHGFSIEGLGIQLVLPAGEEFEVPLSDLEAGRIYRIQALLTSVDC